MKIQEKHQFHGAALAQIVEHDAYKALNSASNQYGHYRVNDDRDVFIKYRTRNVSPWVFPFAPEEVKAIKNAIRDGKTVFLCLVCGEETICALTGDDIGAVINLGSRSTQSITVTVPPKSSCHVKGSKGKLGHAIAHNAFPAILFEDPRRNPVSDYDGLSTATLKGKPVVDQRRIGLKKPIRGGASQGEKIGSGRGLVNLGLSVSGFGKERKVRLPAGTSFVPDSTEFQNGVLVQDVVLVIPVGKTIDYVLMAYCANQSRAIPGSQVTFTIGPVIHSPALDRLIEILKGKHIPVSKTKIVQSAVWEATECHELREETVAALNDL